LTIKKLFIAKEGAIGIGSLIIFIAMMLVAGIVASTVIQIMSTLQQQALETSTETIKDIASGLEVTQISGKTNGDKITELAILINLIPASYDIDLNQAHIEISDTNRNVILYYDSNFFNNSLSNGLFGSLNLSGLNASYFGIIVIRDRDGSCSSTNPILNEQDIVALMVNLSNCFGEGTPSSGIGTRTEVFGSINPEVGMRGLISFITPSAFIENVINLQ